jgi:putative oxidoreductase
MTVGILIQLAIRCLLVILFLPFSALDKIVNFRGAVAQAKQAIPSPAVATAAIVAGAMIEIVMSAGILTGIADRMAAFLLGGYCMVTALLWKQFWVPADFWRAGESKGRDLFWDFLKNFSLAGGFLILAFGVTDQSAIRFLSHPLASSRPYGMAHEDGTP